jgi:putative transposase
MKFVFIAKHRNTWPVAWLCNAMGVSRSGFHACLNRSPSARSRSDEAVGQQVKASFLASDRTYGARRVWRDVLADGVECGLHRIERLMRLQGLRARPRRRRLPKDEGDRQIAAVPANLLDRQFAAERPNQKWIADFTYIWTAEGWLYVSAVIDLFSRRVVGWSMSAGMTAQLVADALLMAVWRRGKPDALMHHSDRGSQYASEQFQRLMADSGIVCSMSGPAMSGTTQRWRASSRRWRPSAPAANTIAPGTRPEQMCSTTSSDSITPSAAIRGSDTSALLSSSASWD